MAVSRIFGVDTREWNIFQLLLDVCINFTSVIRYLYTRELGYQIGRVISWLRGAHGAVAVALSSFFLLSSLLFVSFFSSSTFNPVPSHLHPPSPPLS